jgi:hypothetical protein
MVWDNNDGREGNVFTVPIVAQSLSTAGPADVWGFQAPAGSRFEVMSVMLGQTSTAASGVQGLGVSLFRGSTGVSTGGAITPSNTKGWSGAPVAGTTVTGPSSNLVSTASATLVYADSFEAANGRFAYAPDPTYRPVFTNSQRFHIRVTTPQVALSVHGSVTFREVARGLPA